MIDTWRISWVFKVFDSGGVPTSFLSGTNSSCLVGWNEGILLDVNGGAAGRQGRVRGGPGEEEKAGKKT